MTELIVTFRNSTDGPKKRSVIIWQGKVAVRSEIDTKHKFAVWAEGRISECETLYSDTSANEDNSFRDHIR